MTTKPKTEPVLATMDFDTFAKQKATRQRASQYAPFILALAPKKVYDASATFPGTKAATLRGALYLQARRLNKVISILLDPKSDHLLAAYIADQTTFADAKAAHATRTHKAKKGGK